MPIYEFQEDYTLPPPFVPSWSWTCTSSPPLTTSPTQPEQTYIQATSSRPAGSSAACPQCVGATGASAARTFPQSSLCTYCPGIGTWHAQRSPLRCSFFELDGSTAAATTTQTSLTYVYINKPGFRSLPSGTSRKCSASSPAASTTASATSQEPANLQSTTYLNFLSSWSTTNISPKLKGHQNLPLRP